MNDNYKLDISYLAGLFDGKGSVSYKNKVWKMEMSMPDKNVMELVHETLECGTLREKKVAGKKNIGDGNVQIEIVFLLPDNYGLIPRLSYIK